MNRQIKFRALTQNNNVMCFGDLITCPDGGHRMLWFELKGELPLDVDFDSFNELVQSSTIGQFTGFTDFDGKEIYEGDILEYVGTRSEGKRYRDIIEFDVLCGSWYGKRTANLLSDILFYQHNDSWKKSQNYSINENQRVRVIGNIFQNPELLTN